MGKHFTTEEVISGLLELIQPRCRNCGCVATDWVLANIPEAKPIVALCGGCPLPEGYEYRGQVSYIDLIRSAYYHISKTVPGGPIGPFNKVK